jgi:hypothetical protein
MISAYPNIPPCSLLPLENAMGKMKVSGSLIGLPFEILHQIITYLAPRPKDYREDKDRIRKQAHNYVLEFACVHSSLKAVGVHHLWTYRVAEIDYDQGNEIAITLCQQQDEINFCPDTPPGVDVDSVVKGLCCRWGRRCYECENVYDLMQGSSLYSLVSRFAHLTELALQIWLSTNALGVILQSCHLTLQILDFRYDCRVVASSPLPSLPQLSQLTIRFDRNGIYRPKPSYKQMCTDVVYSFVEVVSSYLYKMVIMNCTLEPCVVSALTALRGLKSLHILDEPLFAIDISTVNEHAEPFPPASQLQTLSILLSLWYMFPQGYFESLQVLKLDGDYYKDSIPRNPCFPTALRSVSVNFPLDLAGLRTLGTVSSLEYLELNLLYQHNQKSQHFVYDGEFDPHAFLQLKELTIHQYYFGYMQNFELLKLRHFEFSDLIYNSDVRILEILEIPWRDQLISFSVTCLRRVTWNTKASFSKLEVLNLNFALFAGPVRCQFPALRKLKLLHGDICDTLEIIPSTFPKLCTFEVEIFIGTPIRIPLKYFSSASVTLEVLNSLMKYNEMDVVNFINLFASSWKTLEFYWHNTSSSIQLWKLIPAIKICKAETNRLSIVILSSDIDHEVILPVVLWYMKRRPAQIKPKIQAKGINYDYAKATISFIIKVEALKDSSAFKALVRGIREFKIHCKINIISSPRDERV